MVVAECINHEHKNSVVESGPATLSNHRVCLASLKMDGFLEANRVVEVSLSKLNSFHKGGDLPLRKTLLISKVLNRAQDVATSAHLSFITTPSTSRSSSKLLASISKKVEDTSVYESDCLPVGLPRPAKQQQRQSPIASCTVTKQEDEEPMDFENVNSVLSDILSSDSEIEVDSESTAACESEVPHFKESSRSQPTLNKNEQISSPSKRSKLLGDISNTSNSTSGWNAWQFEQNSNLKLTTQWTTPYHTETSCSPPASPGKRNHHAAFPFEKENNWWSTTDDTKRFKPSPPEEVPLESLPGFCGYLSPRNLQTAPLITIMFGKGFALPSESTSSDWPSSFSDHELGFTKNVNHSFSENHFLPPVQTSVKPILAF